MSESSYQSETERYLSEFTRLTLGEREIVAGALAVARTILGVECEPHFCFRNAQAVVTADHSADGGSKTLGYFEGLIPSPEGVAPHAWIEINGKTVDITLMASPEGRRLLEKIKYADGQEVAAETVRAVFASGVYRSIRNLQFVRWEDLPGAIVWPAASSVLQ